MEYNKYQEEILNTTGYGYLGCRLHLSLVNEASLYLI